MINLLPNDEKRSLRMMYRLRVLVVTLFLTICFELLLVLMFSPSFFSELVTTRALSRELELKRSGVPKDIESIQGEVTHLKNEVDLLRGQNEILPSALIDELAKAKGDGVSLAGFFYDKTTNTAQVRGYAVNRDALTIFRKKLRESEMFQSADVPPSILLKDVDVDFTIKISLKK
jgi:hypothetical protein